MRKVILHYHLFKNAGTSLDSAFKENFSEDEGEWVTREFSSLPAVNREEVSNWIEDNPQAICFSSHTIFCPPPRVKGVEIFPVVFIRHPLDRIISAYNFERLQTENTFGAVLAKEVSIKGYLKVRLSLPSDRQCKNFQTSRLASMVPKKLGVEAERALMAIDRLPFIGLVEDYDSSLEVLEELLESRGYGKLILNPFKKNVTNKDQSNLDDRLNNLENELGEELYSMLLEANYNDIVIYQRMVRCYEEIDTPHREA